MALAELDYGRRVRGRHRVLGPSGQHGDHLGARPGQPAARRLSQTNNHSRSPLSVALASNNHPRTRFSLTDQGGPQDLSEVRRAARRGGSGGAGAGRKAASQAAGRRRPAPSMPQAGSNNWVLAAGRAVAPGGGRPRVVLTFFEGAAPPGSCLTWRLLPEKGSRARRPPGGVFSAGFSVRVDALSPGTINLGSADRAPAIARPTHPGQAGVLARGIHLISFSTSIYSVSSLPPPCPWNGQDFREASTGRKGPPGPARDATWATRGGLTPSCTTLGRGGVTERGKERGRENSV